VMERHLAKVDVVSSNLIARSIFAGHSRQRPISRQSAVLETQKGTIWGRSPHFNILPND
jgi:hypothetical protein